MPMDDIRKLKKNSIDYLLTNYTFTPKINKKIMKPDTHDTTHHENVAEEEADAVGKINLGRGKPKADFISEQQLKYER